MNAPFRIAGAGRLNDARHVSFSFDGNSHGGLVGDTLASALLANGVHLVGRSFKYHRPRGVLSAGSEEPSALVGIHRDAARKVPNVRATVQELYDGLHAVSQNRWPSLSFDAGAVNSLAAPFFSAGFYYKTFMWPKAAWTRLYEPSIREAAGPGARARHAGSRPLRIAVRALRRAGDRRRRGRPFGRTRGGREGRAGGDRRRAGGLRRRAALRDRRRDRRQGRLDLGAGDRREAGVDGQRDGAAAHHGVRLLRPEHGGTGGTADRAPWPNPIRHPRASGCGRCGRSAW